MHTKGRTEADLDSTLQRRQGEGWFVKQQKGIYSGIGRMMLSLHNAVYVWLCMCVCTHIYIYYIYIIYIHIYILHDMTRNDIMLHYVMSCYIILTNVCVRHQHHWLAFPKWCSHFLFDPDLEYLRFPQQETGCNQVAASVCAKRSEYGLPIGEVGESREAD